MPLYDRPVRLLMRDMIAELAPDTGVVFTRRQAISWFAEHYPKIQEGTVAAHLLRFSTNARARIHYSPRPDEDILFQIDRSHFRRYEPTTDPAPIHSKADAADPTGESEDEEVPVGPSEFAYERDLRDFLAKHPSLIEPGLQLYEDEEGITGVEFPVGGRFADLLAVDAENRLVVIELKVSRGYDRVVGQLLRYMAWIEKHMAEPQQGVRGVIIAREISEDLKLACSSIPAVELFEYELSVVLRGVEV
jgi:endonuclease